MDPSSAQHHQQEMATQTLETMLVSTKAQQDQKKPRPQPEQALKCPRCDSTNTKFCYYNNYSLSQPRYFCKSCRRYWTKGGTLRNVPVGGGCRKSKRSSLSSSSSSNSRRATQDHQSLVTTTNPNPLIPTLPPLTYDHSTGDHHHHLGIAFARLHKQLPNGQLGFDHDHDHGHEPSMLGNTGGHFQSTPTSFFDVLKSGFLDSQHGFSNLYYGMGNGNLGGGGGGGGVENGGEEMVMPYEAVSVTTTKQEMCNGRDGENRVLWGFPWQIGVGGGGGGGDGNLGSSGSGGGGGDLDSGRDSYWNGIGSSWHGLLNSPLM